MIPATPPGFSNMQQQMPVNEEIAATSRMMAGMSATNRILTRKPFDSESMQFAFQRFFGFIEYTHQQPEDVRAQLLQIIYPIFLHLYISSVEVRFSRRLPGSMRYSLFDGERLRSYMQCFSPQYKDEMEKVFACKSLDDLNNSEVVQRLRKRRYDVRVTRGAYDHALKYLYEFSATPLIDIALNYVNFIFANEPVTRFQPMIPPKDTVANVVAALKQKQLQQQLLQDDKRLAIPPIPSQPVTGVMGSSAVVPQQQFQQQQLLGQPSVIPGTSSSSSQQVAFQQQQQLQQQKLGAFSSTQITAPGGTVPPAGVMVQQPTPSVSWETEVRMKRPALPSICCVTLLNAEKSLQALAIHPSGCIIAGGFAESIVRMWSTQGLNPKNILLQPRPLYGPCGPVNSLSFSRDSKNLLVASSDGSVRLWQVSLSPQAPIVCYKGHPPGEPIWHVAFNPDGFYFVTCSHDNTARIWTTNCIRPVRILVGHTSDVTTAQFHPNGAYVATGSADCSVRLWSIADGNCVRVFDAKKGGHTGPISSLAFSPSGKSLVSASLDGQICLWDIASSKLILQYSGRTGVPVYVIKYSPDGGYIASGGPDGCVRLWNATDTYIESIRASSLSSSVPALSSPAPSSLLLSDSLAHGETQFLHADGPMCEFQTKNTQIYTLEFVQRFLMVAGPSFQTLP